MACICWLQLRGYPPRLSWVVCWVILSVACGGYLEYYVGTIMNIELRRFAYTPMGTFGKILTPSASWFTVECPWLGNEPFVSCVPMGIYGLVRRESPRHGATFFLEGPGVSLIEEVGSVRYSCLFHRANLASELQGCIAPGNRLGVLDNSWAVLGSGDALRPLLDFLRSVDEPINLNITFGPLDS